MPYSSNIMAALLHSWGKTIDQVLYSLSMLIIIAEMLPRGHQDRQCTDLVQLPCLKILCCILSTLRWHRRLFELARWNFRLSDSTQHSANKQDLLNCWDCIKQYFVPCKSVDVSSYNLPFCFNAVWSILCCGYLGAQEIRCLRFCKTWLLLLTFDRNIFYGPFKLVLKWLY